MESNAYKAMEELESLPQNLYVEESCELPTPILLKVIATILMIGLGVFAISVIVVCLPH